MSGHRSTVRSRGGAPLRNQCTQVLHGRAVARAQEPALVPEQHLVLEARRVDDRLGRARQLADGVAPHVARARRSGAPPSASAGPSPPASLARGPSTAPASTGGALPAAAPPSLPATPASRGDVRARRSCKPGSKARRRTRQRSGNDAWKPSPRRIRDAWTSRQQADPRNGDEQRPIASSCILRGRGAPDLRYMARDRPERFREVPEAPPAGRLSWIGDEFNREFTALCASRRRCASRCDLTANLRPGNLRATKSQDAGRINERKDELMRGLLKDSTEGDADLPTTAQATPGGISVIRRFIDGMKAPDRRRVFYAILGGKALGLALLLLIIAGIPAYFGHPAFADDAAAPLPAYVNPINTMWVLRHGVPRVLHAGGVHVPRGRASRGRVRR